MGRRKPGRMAKLGDQTFKKTNQEFADEEAELLLRTSIDWEALRPKVTDSALYDQLIAIVNEATQKNESIAQLKNRLSQLGKEGFNLVKKVVKFIS